MSLKQLFNLEKKSLCLTAISGFYRFFTCDDDIYEIPGDIATSATEIKVLLESDIKLDLTLDGEDYIGSVYIGEKRIQIFPPMTTLIQLFSSTAVVADSDPNGDKAQYEEWKKLYVSYTMDDSGVISVRYQLDEWPDTSIERKVFCSNNNLVYDNVIAFDGEVNRFSLDFNVLRDRLNGYYTKKSDDKKYYMKGIAIVDEALVGKSVPTLQYEDKIKIVHANTGARLHSHTIHYSGGSQQQEVTCYKGNDDNDYWVIMPNRSNSNATGTIENNSIIMLRHNSTGNMLHSHPNIAAAASPNFQEVTCYGGADDNDYWKIDVVNGSKLWTRNTLVRFIHVNTNVALHSVAGKLTVNSKQQEVCGNKGRDDSDYWFVNKSD